MPYSNGKMTNYDYTVDSEGNAYIISRVYQGIFYREDNQNEEKNHQIELIKFETRTGTITQQKVELEEGKYINGLKLFESGKDKITCTGFYSPGGKYLLDYSHANGVFKIDFKKNLEEVRTMTHDISLELIDQNLTAVEKVKNKRKTSPAITELKLEEVRMFNDGSIVLIGEQQYYEKHSYSDSNRNEREKTTYHYNSVLITKINKDGTLGWMKKLAKRQQGNSDWGLSYKLIEGEEDIYLIYTDNPKNFELDLIEAPKTYKRSRANLNAFKINYAGGETSKIVLLSKKNKEMRISRIDNSRMIPHVNDEFIIELTRKEGMLVKVKLN